MNLKRWGAALFVPLTIATIACVCTSALPFGGPQGVEATVEAGVGTDLEGIQATAEAIGGEIDIEEAQATAAVALETAEAIAGGITVGGGEAVDSKFPIPPELDMVLLNEPDSLLLTVKLSKDEIIAFYRRELTAMGLRERPLLTVTTEDTFSMVFDGWEDGRSVVVQGTSLGDTYSVSVRLENV